MKNHRNNEDFFEVKEPLDKIRSYQQPTNKYTLLEKVQRHINLNKRIRMCSTIPIKNTSVITMEAVKGQGTNIYGLARCGNKCCVVCSNQATAKQTEQVQEILNKSFGAELPVFFSTFTIARNNNIKKSWNSITKISQEFKRRLKKSLLKEFGVEFKYIFNRDFTFTKDKNKGIYHTHIHALFILNKALKITNKANLTELPIKNALKRFEAIVKRLWVETSNHFKIRATMESQDIQEVDKESDKQIKNYVLKISKNNSNITYEVSRNSSKKSKNNNTFSLFEMLDIIYKSDNEDKSLIRIYREFTNFVSGRQFYSKSRNIDSWLDKYKNAQEEEICCNNEDLNTELDIEPDNITIDLSITLYKHISTLQISGLCLQLLEDQFDGKNKTSFESFQRLSDYSIEVYDYRTSIQQLQLLRPLVIDFYHSLFSDGLISDMKQKIFTRIYDNILTL